MTPSLYVSLSLKSLSLQKKHLLTENDFCLRHKNRRKYNLKKFTLWCIKLKTYIEKTKFTSHKQYLFVYLIIFSLEMQKRDSHRPRQLKAVLPCLKRSNLQTFKCISCKKLFFPAYMLLIQLAWMIFLMQLTTGRHSFS